MLSGILVYETHAKEVMHALMLLKCSRERNATNLANYTDLEDPGK